MSSRRDGAAAMLQQSLLYLVDAYSKDGKAPEEIARLIDVDVSAARKLAIPKAVQEPKQDVSSPLATVLVDDLLTLVQSLKKDQPTTYRLARSKLTALKELL